MTARLIKEGGMVRVVAVDMQGVHHLHDPPDYLVEVSDGVDHLGVRRWQDASTDAELRSGISLLGLEVERLQRESEQRAVGLRAILREVGTTTHSEQLVAIRDAARVALGLGPEKEEE